MSQRRKISVKAPGKLMLVGEHAVVYGAPCLVSAVGVYTKVEISSAEKDTIEVPPGAGTRFVAEILRVWRDMYSDTEPIMISTKSSVGKYGLGSSAAVIVATVYALSQYFDKPLTHAELFRIAYDIVRRLQGRVSGFDIAASIYGNTMYFEGDTKKTKVISVEKLPILIGFSGSKAQTVDMVQEVARKKNTGRNNVQTIFSSITQIVQESLGALRKKDFSEMGTLMVSHHRLLQELGVSTEKLDAMVQAAVNAGAYGAKLSGAGGGDCMIALASSAQKVKVEHAIEQCGGTILSFNVGNVQGVHSI